MMEDKMTEEVIRFCTITIKFDAAHRIIGHKNKCQYIHGHSYNMEITAASLQLDELGMVVDFSLLKSAAEEWVKQNFDHTVILSKKDQELGNSIEKATGQKVFYLDGNPTAEEIATFFKYDICERLFEKYKDQFVISKIRLYESPKFWVEV